MKELVEYFICFALLLFSSEARAQLRSMENCACACGLDSTTNSGGVMSTGGADTGGSFLDHVRGPKGDLGRTGKPGVVGPPGTPGLRGPQGPPGQSGGGRGGGGTIGESCMDFRSRGFTDPGIYTIKPTRSASETQVYCDMASAGGGWTLVASIHENNIFGKCSAGDMWSSEQGNMTSNYTGSGNWENFNAFGNVEAATSSDYKSTAYYNLLASDVMVWHVPNDVSVDQWPQQAFLKYYTTSGFLAKRGGTLQSLYSKHFPLKKQTSQVNSRHGIVNMLAALNGTASRIRNLIPNFYSYTYDFSGIQNHISDGGGDMFDTGNKVYYKIGDESYQQITYRQVYEELANQVEVSSTTEHPFVTLMWVGNQGRSVDAFSLKVLSGTGADGSGSSTSYTGEIESGNFYLKYKAYSVYNANDPSICEVFFYIASATNWNSVRPTTFETPIWSSATDNLQHSLQVSGSPSSILMGYTLLSREDDYQVTDSHVRSALNVMLETISSFQQVEELNCSRLADSLSVPVQYIQGDNDVVMSHVPPSQRPSSQPGYIHFRPISLGGIPNALCPGVQTESCRPSEVCVGGMNSFAADRSACGDFAGWAGSGSLSETEPVGAAHSLNDINSSLLIFTRSGTSVRKGS